MADDKPVIQLDGTPPEASSSGPVSKSTSSPPSAPEDKKGKSVHDEEAGDGIIPGKAQHGVQAMEATTAVWTRTHLIVAYVMIVSSSSH